MNDMNKNEQLKHALEAFGGLLLTLDQRLKNRRDLLTCDELRSFVLAHKNGCKALGGENAVITRTAPSLYDYYKLINRADLAKEIA